MPAKQVILDQIRQQGVLPLFYHNDVTISIGVLRALYAAGIRTVEYTNRGEAALANFRAMRKCCEAEMKDMFLGVGTIKDAAAAISFIEAGCDYLISPGLVPNVVEIADENNLTWIPGCMTPTEIIAAESMGAKLVKLFPGNILGPGYMAAIKDIFPDLLFMPTGGVEPTEESIAAWFGADVCAVGMGSKLITQAIMQNKEYEKLTADTQRIIAISQACKK